MNSVPHTQTTKFGTRARRQEPTSIDEISRAIHLVFRAFTGAKERSVRVFRQMGGNRIPGRAVMTVDTYTVLDWPAARGVSLIRSSHSQ